MIDFTKNCGSQLHFNDTFNGIIIHNEPNESNQCLYLKNDCICKIH